MTSAGCARCRRIWLQRSRDLGHVDSVARINYITFTAAVVSTTSPTRVALLVIIIIIIIIIIPTGQFTYTKKDVVFLLDNSGSIHDTLPIIDAENWDLTKQFVNSLLNGNALTIGVDYDRVAVVTFSTMARLFFDLNAYQSASAIVSKMATIGFEGGTTHTYDAFTLATTILGTSSYGGRPGQARPVVILVTDGWPNPASVDPSPLYLLKQNFPTALRIGW